MTEPYRYIDEDNFCLSARLLPNLDSGGVTDTLSITIEGSDEPQSVHVRATDAPAVTSGILRAAGQQPAVVPPADRAALRDRIVEAVQRCTEEGNVRYGHIADAILSVLPTTTNQTAAEAERDSLGREADRLRKDWLEMRTRAEHAERIRENADFHLGQEMARRQLAEKEAERLRAELRRVAGETQQPETQAEAHPAEHKWAAELHDPAADEWVPGTRYTVRERAVKALEHGRRIGPTWKDGTPTERRLVRATTTYTVEDEHLPAPAVVVQPAEPAETQQATPCGPVSDQCDAEAGEPCANHEREQAHAEGEHCFCGPECGGEAKQP